MQISDKYYISQGISEKAHGISEKLQLKRSRFFCLLPFAFYLKTALCLLLAFYLMPFALFAADPVTVIVSLSPPYTPFLNEYGSNGADKLQVSLIVNDSRVVNYPAKLQMLIEHVGSGIVMRTSEYAAIAPIMLTGNVTEVFNGFDLNKYFLAQNNVFTGFDQSQYIQTGRIPDGQYRIGFRIVDAQRTDVVISNTAYTQPGWFVLNDPPQINLPRNKEKVRVNDLQYVKLEWFPRHLGSLNAAFATSYQIELFAIRVPGMNPNQVAMSMQPDFTDVTNRTSYYLTNDKYLLEPGVEYAYRIKAIAGDDQLTLFQNNGYSEVFSFIYGSLCPLPENVSAQTLGTDKVEITWDTDPLQTSFETRFRKAGQVNDAWHTRESFVGMTEIANVLSPGVKYEYRVKATCTTVESDYSALDYFTMPYPPNAKFECGAVDSVMVSNTIPKASLQEGEMIFYGHFPIKLTEISGSNGVFTGKGRMRIPFLANIQVNMQFANIQVNELNQVYGGELVSIYNEDSKFLIDDVSDYFTSGDQVGNVVTGEESAAITLGYVVDNASSLTVTVTGTTVTVTGPGGSVSADIETATGGTTISDSEGNLYVVSEDGSVSQVGTSGGTSDAGNYSGNSAAYNQLSTDATIEFVNDNSDTWAFDERNDIYENSTKINSEYELLGDYYVPWKLIPEGKSGKVKAKITSGSIDPVKVVFKTPTGTEYIANYNGSEFELTIVGSEHGDAQEIYALYQENDSTTKSLGKLKAASYNIIKGKLAIVPIGDAELSAESIKSQLDDIYLPYGIEWEVRSEPKFTNMDWAGDDQKLDAGESGFFSVYNAEMKALNNAFKAERTVNDDEVYLFVFNTEAANVESGVLLGDMPVGCQYGYLFSPTEEPITAKTIAHELGHGVFLLKHTFDNSYGLDEGTTANLMDYSSGEELVKQQWDAIHDPAIMLFSFLQDEEEGAYISETFSQEVARFINYIKCAKVKGSPTAEIHHGWNSYEVKIGSVISLLNANGPGTITSTELSNAKLRVMVSHGYGSEPTDIFVGYQDITLNVNQAIYTAQNGLNIPANKGGMYFSAPIGTSAELKTQIFNWLQKECGLTGGQPTAINVNNNSTLKANDVFLYSICELEQINRSNRETLVRELMGNQEDWAGLDKDTYQYLLVNLLKTTPVGDKAHFYKLFKDNPKWLSFLYGNMASAQRDKLMKILIELWYNNYSGNVNLAKAEAKNAFIVTNSIFGNASNYVGFSAQGEVIFTVPQIQVSEYMATESNEEVFRTAPFEPVFLGIEGDNSDKPFTVLPAICIKYYTDKGNMANMKEALMLTANAALFAVGVGEVVTGVRGAILVARTTGVASTKFLGSCLRISLGVADLAASITSNYCTATNSSSEFCQTWKEYEFYINMGLLTASVSDMLYTKLSNSYTTNVKSKLSGEQVAFIENELGITVRAGDNISTLIARWDNLTITEAKSLYNQLARTDIIGSKAIRTQSDILTEVKQRGITNPYSFTYAIEDYTLTKDVFFVRCYTGERKIGRWLIAIDDMPSFSSVDDFIKRTALPVIESTGDLSKPSKVVLIKIPSGTKIRKSIARPQDWGGYGHLPGGATQYEILDFEFESMRNWFKDIGNINEFIK